jgi:hypothetical protein
MFDARRLERRIRRATPLRFGHPMDAMPVVDMQVGQKPITLAVADELLL